MHEYGYETICTPPPKSPILIFWIAICVRAAGFSRRVETTIADNWYPVTLGLFSFPLWCLFTAVFGFIAFIPVSKYHAIVAFLLALGTIAWTCSWKVKQSTALSAVFCALLAVPFFCSLFIFENIWDGVQIYQPGAISIAKGWNPIWEYDPVKGYEPMSLLNVNWVQYYPKADWIISAVLYSFTGNLYCNCILNLILALTVFPVLYISLNSIFSLSKWKIIFLTLCTAFNPISSSQLFFSKQDGIAASCLSIIFFGLAAYLKSKDKRLLPFITGSIIIATNVKFTNVVFIGLFLVALLLPLAVIGLWNKRPLQKTLCGTLCAATVLSLIIGINPYIYNLYHHWSPFYPLMTVKKEDEKKRIDLLRANETGISNVNWKETNRLQRFIYSHCIPGGDYNGKIDTSALFVPASQGETWHLYFHGFGTFFSIPLCFSIFMFPFIRGKHIWLLFIGIWLTVLTMPDIVNARYCPQIWLLPVVVIGSVWTATQKSETCNIRMNFVAVIMLLLCLYCGGMFFKAGLKENVWICMRNYASLLRYHDKTISFDLNPQYPLDWRNKAIISRAKFTFYQGLVCDIFPNAGFNLPNHTVRIGYLPLYSRVFATPDIELLPPLTKKDLPKMIRIILQLRISQFKRVWGLEQPPIASGVKTQHKDGK